MVCGTARAVFLRVRTSWAWAGSTISQAPKERQFIAWGRQYKLHIGRKPLWPQGFTCTRHISIGALGLWPICNLYVSPRNPDPASADPEPRRGRPRELAWRCLIATRRSSGSRSSVAPVWGSGPQSWWFPFYTLFLGLTNKLHIGRKPLWPQGFTCTRHISIGTLGLWPMCNLF